MNHKIDKSLHMSCDLAPQEHKVEAFFQPKEQKRNWKSSTFANTILISILFHRFQLSKISEINEAISEIKKQLNTTTISNYQDN